MEKKKKKKNKKKRSYSIERGMLAARSCKWRHSLFIFPSSSFISLAFMAASSPKKCKVSVFFFSESESDAAAAAPPPPHNRRVGTHNGSFHCDEALGCFMIRLTDKFRGAEIVRTRDSQVLDALGAVLDVGGVYDPTHDRYDHHQKGF